MKHIFRVSNLLGGGKNMNVHITYRNQISIHKVKRQRMFHDNVIFICYITKYYSFKPEIDQTSDLLNDLSNIPNFIQYL